MEESILNSIKLSLGLSPDYNPFDSEIQMHINSAFSTLHQLGVGSVDGFEITGPDEVWSDFLRDKRTINNVRSYIFMRTKMMFDPPSQQHLLAAYEKRIEEEEWRLRVATEPYEKQVETDVDYGIPDAAILDAGGP